MTETPFKVGDTAYYRDHAGTVSKGTVYQVEGGKDGDLTEVYWPGREQALWMPTKQLWAEEPSWTLDQKCVCGCTFGVHIDSGCIPHQRQPHKFKLETA